MGSGAFAYENSAAGSIIFAVLFAGTLLVHTWQAVRPRAWYLMPLLIATVMQVVGYITRYTSRGDDAPLWQVIISQACLVVSPAFLQAETYMIIGRLMSYVGRVEPLIRHTLITKIFVGIDVLSILVQTSSSGLLVADNIDSIKLGHKMIIAGLVVQVIAFAAFLVIAIHYDITSRRVVGSEMSRFRSLWTAFYISAVLIMIRSIFRAAEFASISFSQDDPSGYLATHEWPFYVLDSVPIFLATIVFNVWHPVNFLPTKKGLQMDGTYAMQPKHWWSKEPTKRVDSVESGGFLPVSHRA